MVGGCFESIELGRSSEVLYIILKMKARLRRAEIEVALYSTIYDIRYRYRLKVKVIDILLLSSPKSVSKLSPSAIGYPLSLLLLQMVLLPAPITHQDDQQGG